MLQIYRKLKIATILCAVSACTIVSGQEIEAVKKARGYKELDFTGFKLDKHGKLTQKTLKGTGIPTEKGGVQNIEADLQKYGDQPWVVLSIRENGEELPLKSSKPHLININAAYANKYKIKVPRVAFSIEKSPDVLGYPVFPPKARGFLSYKFGGTNGKVRSAVSFTSLTVPMTSIEKRLNMVKKVLEANFTNVQEGLPKTKKTLMSQKTNIAGYPSWIVIGKGEYTKGFVVHSAMVGMIRPDSPNGLSAMAHIVQKFSKYKEPEDFLSFGPQVMKLLHSVKFDTSKKKMSH